MTSAASATDIANMAISNLGTAKEIDDLWTERSQEANACRRYYGDALKMAIRDGNWGFTKDVVQLAVVTDFRPRQYPNTFDFAYQWPANTLIVRRLVSGVRVDTLDSGVPWEKRTSQNGNQILTNLEGAYAEVSKLIEAVELMDSDFIIGLSHLLAHMIAPRLTAGDPRGQADREFQKYMTYNSIALKNDGIEGNIGQEHDSDLIRARY